MELSVPAKYRSAYAHRHPDAHARRLCSRQLEMRVGYLLPLRRTPRDELLSLSVANAIYACIDEDSTLRPLALILLWNDLSENGFVKWSEVRAAPEIPE